MRISTGRRIPGKGNRNVRALDAGIFLAWSSNNKEVNGNGAE